MSDLLLRQLAQACAARLAGKVQSAVNQVVQQELAGTIQEILREQYPGESLKVYVAKRPGGSRRERDNLIRTRYNGKNAEDLARDFELNVRQVYRIVGRR